MKKNKSNAKSARYDGRSRPSDNLYRNRWNEIFGKKKITDDNAEQIVHGASTDDLIKENK